MIPRCSSTNVVQTVPVGRISWSRGQKIGFQNAILKNPLVWNYKAQSYHIWYIAISRGPLPKLFKLCPLGQNWPRPGGHNFTLNYVRKSSFLEPLMGIWPNSTKMVPGWSPSNFFQMVRIGDISRSRGLKVGVQNSNFKTLLVWNYKALSFHI